MSSKDLDPRKILEEHPEWANWTLDDLRAEECRLQASIEDRENRLSQLYRQNGCLAPYDCRLFHSVWRDYSKDATVSQVMEALRVKRRRGHKQQEALDIWDAHYAHLDEVCFPDEEMVDRIEALFEEQEAAREKPKR